MTGRKETVIIQKIADTISADSMYFADALMDFLRQHKLILSFEKHLDRCQKEGDYVWDEMDKTYFQPDRYEGR